MDSAIQDEDVLWQRAFADSAGLFDNNLFFDPLVLSVNTLTPNNAGQIPTPFNNSVAQPAAASPSPELDYVAPAAPAPLLRPCPPETGAPATWKQLKSATTPTVPTTLVGPGLPCSSSSGEPGPAVASMAPASTESTSEDLQASLGVMWCRRRRLLLAYLCFLPSTVARWSLLLHEAPPRLH